jgi:hypothetical protein
MQTAHLHLANVIVLQSEAEHLTAGGMLCLRLLMAALQNRFEIQTIPGRLNAHALIELRRQLIVALHRQHHTYFNDLLPPHFS